MCAAAWAKLAEMQKNAQSFLDILFLEEWKNMCRPLLRHPSSPTKVLNEQEGGGSGPPPSGWGASATLQKKYLALCTRKDFWALKN